VLLFFHSLAQQCTHLILNSSALLTSPFICARFVRPHGWQKKLTDEKNAFGAECSKPCWEDNPAKVPADIMTRLRARHHNQKNHCQRNQPGDHDCQCAKNADRQTKLLRKKKPTD